jgi:hypothetical protein
LLNPQALDVIPHLIGPMKDGLNTRDIAVVTRVLNFLQKFLQTHEAAGRLLVPLYRQLLPIMGTFLRCPRDNIGPHVRETLEAMESAGGQEAFTIIKSYIPTYESAR